MFLLKTELVVVQLILVDYCVLNHEDGGGWAIVLFAAQRSWVHIADELWAPLTGQSVQGSPYTGGLSSVLRGQLLWLLCLQRKGRMAADD